MLLLLKTNRFHNTQINARLNICEQQPFMCVYKVKLQKIESKSKL